MPPSDTAQISQAQLVGVGFGFGAREHMGRTHGVFSCFSHTLKCPSPPNSSSSDQSKHLEGAGCFTSSQPSTWKISLSLSLSRVHTCTFHLPLNLLSPPHPALMTGRKKTGKRGHDPSDGIEISLSHRSSSKHELTTTLADK